MLILFFLLSTSAYFQNLADDLIGHWKNEEGTQILLVEKKDGKYIGKIVWVEDKNSQVEAGRKDIWGLTFDSKKESVAAILP